MTLLTYTARGWLNTTLQDSGGLNALTDLDYDAVGQLKKVTQPDDTYLEFDYDTAHRLWRIWNRAGEHIEYDLDNAGNPEKQLVKSDSGSVERTVDYVFDALSRLHQRKGSYGQFTQYDYGSDGHLSEVKDALNRGSVSGFDALGRISSLEDADNETASVEHDGEDRITLVTDQRTLATTYIYDGFGNLKQMTSPDAGVTRYDEYDDAGNLKKVTDARGIVTDYTYDALNRLETVVYPSDTTKNVTYGYDNWGLCFICKGYLTAITDSSGSTVFSYDRLGRVNVRINSVDVPGRPTVDTFTGFGHNKAGRLDSITYPSGQIVNFGIDEAGQVDGVSWQVDANATPQPLASTVSYDPFGPIKRFTYGNGLALTRAYDADGRLETQTVGTKQDLVYEYTNLTNTIWKINDQIDNSRSEVFLYDNLDRLENATGKYGDIGYDYDGVGNRTDRTITRDARITTETYNYPSDSNRLDSISIQEGVDPPKLRSFLYDANGNLEHETRANGDSMNPSYDAPNRMDGVAPTAP